MIVQRVIAGAILIGLLTAALAILEIHTVVGNFFRDKDKVRLVVYLSAILLLCGLLIKTTYRIFDQVIDASTAATAPAAMLVQND